MRRIKFIIVLIWIFNVALIAGSAFFLRNVVMPAKKTPFTPPTRPVTQGPSTDQLKDYSALKSLSNPMESKKVNPTVSIDPGDISSKILLIMTMPHPQEPACCIELVSKRGHQIAVFFKAPITVNDIVIPELAGWVLIEVNSDSVVFGNGDRKSTVKIISSTASFDSNPNAKTVTDLAAITDWKHLNSTSQYDVVTEHQMSWLIDPREAEWVALKQDQILNNDVSLIMHSEGGVKIADLKAGSIVAERGFQKGDVIKSINSRPVNSIADAKALAETLRKEGVGIVTITIDRAGRNFTLSYRLKSN